MEPNEAPQKRMKRSEMRDDVEEVRGDIRTPAREEDPRARAARRAAEIRGHLEADGSSEVDRFYVDPRTIPDGWAYEWKRKSIWGKEDPAHDVELARQGWEPVPASRHPEMMPKGNFQTIERDGMILMERPKELSDDVHRANLKRARQQVRMKEEQLSQTPSGTLPRDEDPRTKPTIKKSFEAMPISEE